VVICRKDSIGVANTEILIGIKLFSQMGKLSNASIKSKAMGKKEELVRSLKVRLQLGKILIVAGQPL
jgi:hypothetical protein